MMTRKLLRIDGRVWSYQSYDDGGCDATSYMMTDVGGEPIVQIDSEKTSSGWNPAFNLYLHTCIYLPYFHQNKMITFLVSLLQYIGQNIGTNFIEISHFLVFFKFFLCFNNCL